MRDERDDRDASRDEPANLTDGPTGSPKSRVTCLAEGLELAAKHQHDANLPAIFATLLSRESCPNWTIQFIFDFLLQYPKPFNGEIYTIANMTELDFACRDDILGMATLDEIRPAPRQRLRHQPSMASSPA
jgi:hypothetical protein